MFIKYDYMWFARTSQSVPGSTDKTIWSDTPTFRASQSVPGNTDKTICSNRHPAPLVSLSLAKLKRESDQTHPLGLGEISGRT